MNTIIIRNTPRSCFRLLVCLAVLAFLLCFAGQKASADFETTFHYIDYEATIPVGSSVTFYKMPFSASGTDNAYSAENGRPGRYVSATGEEGAVGLNAFDVDFSIEDVQAGGSYGFSLNHYSCGVTMTVTGTQVGSGVISFTYGSWGVTNSSGCTIQVPRITVHVVDSGTPCVLASPRLSWSSQLDPYPAQPTAAQPGWSFSAWETRGEYMYAQWAPDFEFQIYEPGGQSFMSAGNGETLVIRQAVIPYETEVPGLHHDGFTYAMEIADYDAYLASGFVEGEPVWQVREITATGTNFRIEHWYQNWWFLRTDGERPQSATDAKVQISCAWGGMTKSFDLLIHYQDVALPTGTDIPMILDVPSNQTAAAYTCHFNDNYAFDNRIWYTGDVDQSSSYFAALFYWDNDGNTLFIGTNEAQPGYYAGNLTLVDGNVAIDAPVIFRVLNPDGSLPEPEQLADSYELNFLLMPEDTKGYNMFPEDWGHIYLQNPAVLAMLYGDDFSCDVEYVRGVRLALSAHRYPYDYESIVLWIDNLDEVPDGSFSVADVTLHWGDWSETTRVTIFFTRPVLPDITFDTAFTGMRAGEEYTAALTLSDESWSDDYSLWYDFNYEQNFDKWSDRSEIGTVQTEFHILPREPGWYLAAPHIHASNMRIQGEIFAFCVADEDGNVPEMGTSFKFHTPCDEVDLIEDGGEYVIRQAVIPNDLEGVYHDGYLGSVEMEDYEAVSLLLGDPEVQITELTETGTELWFNDNALITDGNRPQAAAEARFEIAVDWGEVRRSFELVLVYEEVDLPTGTDIPTVIDLRVGEESVFEFHFNDNYSYRDQLRIWGGLGNDDAEWFNGEFEWRYERNTLYIKPKTARFYLGSLHLLDTNIVCTTPVLFCVRDENGNVPLAQNALILPDDLEIIEEEAFAGLRFIVAYLPAGVSEIGDGAFDSAIDVVIVCDPDSYAYTRCREMGLTVVAR